jgi:hypothetical protein
MAWGRRCDFGCESWPDDDHYKTCPSCGKETTRYSNLRPLDRTEALIAEFEAFYEDYDTNSDPKRLVDYSDIDPKLLVPSKPGTPRGLVQSATSRSD